MNLLAAKLYDPAAAVTKATSALLAMTALDTVNLRLAITVPAHGMVRFRLAGIIHGATTFPTILLGVMNGATVIGRMAPRQTLGNTAVATAMLAVEAEFTVTGLAPGAMNVDAAYGVETVIAATGIKYGGPNNTTANDAFGGFLFEAWDPQPLKAALDGGVNVTQFGGAAGTFAGGRPEVNASHWGGTAVATAVVLNAANIGADAITAAKVADGAIDAGAIAAGAITSAKFAAGAIDAAAIAADAIGAAEFSQAAADKVWATVARTLTANPGLDAAGVRAAIGLAAANLDTQLDALPTAAEIRVEMDANSADLNAIGALVTAIESRTDVATSTRLAAAGYTAPDNAGIAAIKAKTDSLNFTVAGKLNVNVLVVNGVTLQGAGSAVDKWRAV